MPEISFYVLPTQSQPERNLFVCKLVEKIYRSGCFCYVLTDSATQSQHLDDLLWTFRAGSFIPHQIYTGEPPATGQAVLIGSLTAPTAWQNTLINLSANCPENLGQLGRLLEILDNSEETKALGRQRYRQYQQAGLEIVTHKMGS